MKRQDITLGNTNYIIDLYDAYEDMGSSPHFEKFLMLRNGVLENGIYDDTNIMFIQKSIVEEYANNDNSIDVSQLTNVIVFPISNGTISYSDKFTEFSQNFNERTFKIGNNLEKIYDSNFEEASIICDKIRIWIPTVKAKLNAIIDVESFINDIRVHLVCKKSNSCELNAYGEFKYDRDTYSEYIELYMPNISDLFKKSKYYFLDSYNISGIKKRTVLTFLDNVEESYTSHVYRRKLEFETVEEDGDEIPENNEDNVTRILTYKKPKSLVVAKDITKELVKKTTAKNVLYDEILTIDQQTLTGENGLSYKLSVIANNGRTASKYKVSIDEDNVINYKDNPIASSIEINDINSLEGKSISIYDNEDNEIYEIEISNNDLLYDSNNVYSSMNVFTLSSYIEKHDEYDVPVYNENLDNITTVYANDKIYYEEINSLSSKTFTPPIKVIMYPYYGYDVENDIYLMTEDENLNLDVFSIDYHIILQNSYKFIPEDESDNDNKYFKGSLAIQSRFIIPEIYGNNLDDEILNEAYLNMVKEKSYVSYLKEDDDYDDNTDEIIPEGINKCGFKIDISTDINFKNIVSYDIVNIDIENEMKVITNLDYTISIRNLNVDWKSYPDFLAVRVTYYDRHTCTVISGNYMMITKEVFKYILNTNEGRRLNIKNDTHDDMYFIDKINCTVVKKSNENQSAVQSGQRGTSKILYKPIFYKAKDLEQIKLKSGLTQNIGLNLSSMISKVDTFKITIADKEYVEIGRNDQYVIFKINALELSGSAGQYNLLDQNDEYISDGTWYLY